MKLNDLTFVLQASAPETKARVATNVQAKVSAGMSTLGLDAAVAAVAGRLIKLVSTVVTSDTHEQIVAGYVLPAILVAWEGFLTVYFSPGVAGSVALLEALRTGWGYLLKILLCLHVALTSLGLSIPAAAATTVTSIMTQLHELIGLALQVANASALHGTGVVMVFLVMQCWLASTFDVDIAQRVQEATTTAVNAVKVAIKNNDAPKILEEQLQKIQTASKPN